MRYVSKVIHKTRQPVHRVHEVDNCDGNADDSVDQNIIRLRSMNRTPGNILI